MSGVVEGWGVHLSTVEITDVKILSSSLFKDMQTEFRETNVKKALLEKNVVNNNLYFEKLDRDLESSKAAANNDKIRSNENNAQEIKTTREDVMRYR